MTGEAIRHFRESRGWSQGDLAEKLGVDQSTVSRIELGAEPSRPVRRLLEILMTEQNDAGVGPRPGVEAGDAAPPPAADPAADLRDPRGEAA